MKAKVMIFSALVLFSGCFFAACGGKGDSSGQEASQSEIGTTGNPAIDGLTAAIARQPNDPALYFERGRIFYENNGFDEAIRDLEWALSLDSTNVTYLYLLADVYLDYFKSRQALKTMERAIELQPENILSLLKMCEFQHILKQYNESMKTIDRVLRIDPQNADAYFWFGMNFKEQGDTIRAINSFQKAVDFDADLIDAWISLGKLYASMGSPLAARYFENATRIAPEDVVALHARADYLSDSDDLEGAIEMYRRIAAIDPYYRDAFFNSGLIYMDLDSLEAAKQQFDIAIQVSPTFIQAYYYRGLAQEMLGQLPEARADYEQAVRMAPNYDEALDGLDRIKIAQ
jgi:tetratricopeptide (TPR) repeat protein